MRLSAFAAVKAVIAKMGSTFPQGGFAHSVVIVASGTALAQSISIAVAPLLTRLYTPSDYGVFALYSSIGAMICVLATGRYDVAIMLPESDEEAINLMALSVGITVVMSLATVVVALFCGGTVAGWIGNKAVAPWLFMLPLTVGVNSLYRVMSCWTFRQKQFRQSSIGKVCGVTAGAMANIGLGLSWASAGGLIVGSVINEGVSTGILAERFWRGDPDRGKCVQRGLIKVLARRYHRFPLYSLPADFVNVAAQQVPILLLTSFFGSIVVGLFSLTQRVLSLPLVLIATSVLDVFRQRASTDFHLHGDCRYIFIRTLKSLVVLSFVPFILLFLTAPWVFSMVFGSEWRIAGQYARILSPFFFLRFVASPLSYVLYVADKQGYDLTGQVMLLVLAASSVWVGATYQSPKLAVQLYSASYSLVYIYYLIVSFLFSKHRRPYAI